MPAPGLEWEDIASAAGRAASLVTSFERRQIARNSHRGARDGLDAAAFHAGQVL